MKCFIIVLFVQTIGSLSFAAMESAHLRYPEVQGVYLRETEQTGQFIDILKTDFAKFCPNAKYRIESEKKRIFVYTALENVTTLSINITWDPLKDVDCYALVSTTRKKFHDGKGGLYELGQIADEGEQAWRIAGLISSENIKNTSHDTEIRENYVRTCENLRSQANNGGALGHVIFRGSSEEQPILMMSYSPLEGRTPKIGVRLMCLFTSNVPFAGVFDIASYASINPKYIGELLRTLEDQYNK